MLISLFNKATVYGSKNKMNKPVQLWVQLYFFFPQGKASSNKGCGLGSRKTTV